MKQNSRIAVMVALGAIIGLSCSDRGTQAPAEAPAPVPATDQESYATAIVEALQTGDMVGATKRFDAAMRQAVTPAQLREVWASVITAHGAYTGQSGIQSLKEQGYDTVIVTCTFERGTATVKVNFDGALKVVGLLIKIQ